MDEKTVPGGTRPWSIEGPRIGTISPEIRALQSAWYGELVADGVYAPEELEALHQEDAVASWSPADERGTPFTFVGLAPDGRIIGAVSLYGRASDGSWFIDNVIRDQDVTYKGLGQALVREALAWLWTTKGVRSVRVHAMKREERATGYWRWLFGRGHDFDDCFVTSAGHEFPAGGWNIELGWLPRTS